VQISWTGSDVAGVAVALPSGQSLPSWLQVDLTGAASPLTLNVRRVGSPATPGRFSITLSILVGNANYDVLASKDLPVSLDVVALPTLSATSVSTSWVESEAPAPAQITVTHDPRVRVDGANVAAGWLSASVAADVVTIAGTEAARALAPGPYGTSLAVQVSLDGRTRTLPVPISATVARALSGPAEIAFEVDAATDEAALSAARATVTTATQAPLQLTARADVPWIVPADVVTGTADDLALSFPKSEIAALASGLHTGTITLTPTAPNVQALTIPVRLTVRLPEVSFVAPVVFTDTAESDYVIARGAGLAHAAATLRVDGVPVTGATVVSDSEVRFVPGSHAAGDHVVDAPNALGLPRGTAKLRIVDPPPYAAATLPASLGLQDRVVPMSSGGIVFTVLSLNGSVVSGGTSSTVQQFLMDAGTGAWTRTQFNYPDLADIALTPDESQLVVLTKTDLRLVDPRTMATAITIPLPSQIAGGSRQLAVTNDGLLLVQELGKAYSLHERQFVPIPGLGLRMGLGGSRDGSRVFFGDANNYTSNPYRYYDASTGAVVLTQTFKHFSRGIYSRHAERALANSYLCAGDLTFLADLPVDSHTGDLSPDGRRAYGYDSGQLRVVDIADPQRITELTPIPVTDYGLGRMAVEPRGRFGFVAAQNGFIVVDLR
jgi:hypothetical protein